MPDLAMKDEVGELAEELVARWLTSQGYEVLHRRWHCRWGELDLIAQHQTIAPQSYDSQKSLIFVEVKARSRGNWDANGLLSITSQKQKKLWQAAQLFLADYPHLADCPCRFDIALVSCQRAPSHSSTKRGTAKGDLRSPVEHSPSLTPPLTSALGEITRIAGYYFKLHDYIQGAIAVEE